VTILQRRYFGTALVENRGRALFSQISAIFGMDAHGAVTLAAKIGQTNLSKSVISLIDTIATIVKTFSTRM